MSHRPATPSPFRPKRGIDQSVLEENRALIQAINRRKLLRGIHDWFAEGFDTADLRDARMLRDESSTAAT